MKYVTGILLTLILISLFSCNGGTGPGQNSMNPFKSTTNYNVQTDIKDVNEAVIQNPDYEINQEELDILKEEAGLSEEEQEELSLLLNQ